MITLAALRERPNPGRRAARALKVVAQLARENGASMVGRREAAEALSKRFGETRGYSVSSCRRLLNALEAEGLARTDRARIALSREGWGHIFAKDEGRLHPWDRAHLDQLAEQAALPEGPQALARGLSALLGLPCTSAARDWAHGPLRGLRLREQAMPRGVQIVGEYQNGERLQQHIEIREGFDPRDLPRAEYLLQDVLVGRPLSTWEEALVRALSAGSATAGFRQLALRLGLAISADTTFRCSVWGRQRLLMPTTGLSETQAAAILAHTEDTTWLRTWAKEAATAVESSLSWLDSKGDALVVGQSLGTPTDSAVGVILPAHGDLPRVIASLETLARLIPRRGFRLST